VWKKKQEYLGDEKGRAAENREFGSGGDKGGAVKRQLVTEEEKKKSMSTAYRKQEDSNRSN